MCVLVRARVRERRCRHFVCQSGPGVVFVDFKKCNDSLLSTQHLSRPYDGVKEGADAVCHVLAAGEEVSIWTSEGQRDANSLKTKTEWRGGACLTGSGGGKRACGGRGLSGKDQ